MKNILAIMPVLVALTFAVLLPLTLSAENSVGAVPAVNSEASAMSEIQNCPEFAEWSFGDGAFFESRAAGTESASTCQQNCLNDYNRCLDDCSLTDWLCQSRCDHRLRRCESRCPQ